MTPTVGVGVAVRVGITVGDRLGVAVGVGVTVGDRLGVAVRVGVTVGDRLGVAVRVGDDSIAVTVCNTLGTNVAVGDTGTAAVGDTGAAAVADTGSTATVGDALTLLTGVNVGDLSPTEDVSRSLIAVGATVKVAESVPPQAATSKMKTSDVTTVKRTITAEAPSPTRPRSAKTHSSQCE